MAGVAATLALACAGPGGGSVGAPGRVGSVSDAEWRSLATPRPALLPGAVRLSVADVDLLAEPAWGARAAVPARLGLAELVAAGLLRRADVHFVERRRFSAAVDAERSGAPRPAGAPAAGVSPGAELSASVTWLPVGGGRASLEVRLVATASGAVAGARRKTVPEDADPVGLARVTVATILAALAELGRLPTWSDPIAAAAPAEYVASGVAAGAVEGFFAGLAAEEAWSWERAREAYQAAAATGAFFEASAALARTARLRLGGTLGEG